MKPKTCSCWRANVMYMSVKGCTSAIIIKIITVVVTIMIYVDNMYLVVERTISDLSTLAPYQVFTSRNNIVIKYHALNSLPELRCVFLAEKFFSCGIL